MRRSFNLLIVLIVVFSKGFSQTSNYRFRNLTTSNGLSQSSVIAIHQDQLGQMWFGTRDGLNKFDGTSFEIFRNNPTDSLTLSNSDILAIEEDASGLIWVGTYNGLNSYNPVEKTFKKYFHTNNSTSLCNNTIWSIKEIKNEIWIATSNGISIFNKTTGVFLNVFHIPSNPKSLPSNFVLKIIEVANGDIWIATSKGVCKLVERDGANFVFKEYKTNSGDLNTEIFVQDILEDEAHNLWVATKSKGLLKYNSNTDVLELFSTKEKLDSDVRTLHMDVHHNLWIGGYSGVYVLKQKNSKQPKVVAIKDKNITKIKSIFSDVKGSVWVGTYYGGVHLWDKTNVNFTNLNQNSTNAALSFNVVSAMVTDGEKNIYLGTEGGGITVLNTKENSAAYLNMDNVYGLPTNSIKSLLFDDKENLWIGTIGQGLVVYNVKKEKVLDVALSAELKRLLKGVGVYVIKKDGNTIWLGTFGNGLIKYNSKYKSLEVFKSDKEHKMSLTNNRIRSLLIDSKKQIWVGTQSGLNLISSNNDTIKHYFFNSEAFSGDDILTLFEDSKGAIWLGVKAKGFYKFNGVNFERISIDNGEFEITSIHAIVEDDYGSLWLSSNNGIVKYNTLTFESTIYNETDGLISNEFNNNASLKLNENNFYFGGPAGVSYFNPKNIVVNKYAPQVVLTNFKIQNKIVEVSHDNNAILTKNISFTKNVTLDYNMANFSISFAIPNYVNSANNQYAYRLVGLEDEWISTTNTEANYTIQTPGTYTFEVKGANNNGVWNQTPTKLKIVVLPAPWKSWWAFMLYAILLASVLFGLYLFLKSKQKLQHQLEIEHLENERIEKINQAKLQFFTNISHEFRTPLTLILGPLQQLLLNYKGSNKMHKKLLVIESSANHLLQLINRLMDFRKLENNQFKLYSAQGNIVKFLKEIYFSFSEYAKDRDYTYTFECSNETILVYYDRAKLERVFYNLISNAFRFTPKGGEIKLKVTNNNEHIFIAVEDSGVGIAEEYRDKIFDRFFEIEIHNNLKEDYNKGTGIGLSIAKNIVSLHKGAINVTTNNPKGTIFEVAIPLGRAHLLDEEILNDFKTSDDLSQYITQLETSKVEFEDDIDDLVVDDSKPVVLIVEDNKPLRSFIKNLLKPTYNTLEAENGKVGLEKAIQHVPDLIISDVIMPKMVGTEMCSKIKENLKTSHIPIMLLTARSSLIYKFEGLESGADAYISKPFNVKEFKLKVKNMLEAVHRLKSKFSQDTNLSPSEITVSSVDEELLKKAFKIVENNISNEHFDIPFFCEELGVSRTMLFTKIKAWTNFTPNDFIQEIRMKRAVQLLEQNKINISQISYKVGFKNPKYFSKCFQKKYGETPSQYQRKFSSQFLDE
ncbi:two-component regulator propeller domain-containing protein [Lutibacter holmesii]|uniref:histidine kinase n=1 Tax=Lutibacter holmesii TaxID=1137985 RepID=A0ABW3WS07_9FLAO